MHLEKVNLNLLVALDAILTCDTLTQAAASLSVTQSAMSISLRKLRSHFGDEIVVYRRGQKDLTPFGHQLRPQVAEIIQLSRAALRARGSFDPSTLSTTFKVVTHESLEIVFLPSLLRSIMLTAPNARLLASPFDYRKHDPALPPDFDLAIVSSNMCIPRLEREVLFSDAFMCIVCADHPTVGHSLSLAQYRELPHASIDLGAGTDSESRDAFYQEAYGKIETTVVTSTLAALAHVVMGTNLVALLPRSLAMVYARRLPIRILPMPFPTPEVEIVAQWRRYRGEDPELAWLLETVRDTARHAQEMSAR